MSRGPTSSKKDEHKDNPSKASYNYVSGKMSYLRKYSIFYLILSAFKFYPSLFPSATQMIRLIRKSGIPSFGVRWGFKPLKYLPKCRNP